MNKYAMTLETLRTMDEKQLLQMFHDMQDIVAVERIADCAYYFVENEGAIQHHPNKEWVDNNKIKLPSITELNAIAKKQLDEMNHACDAKEYLGKSDEQDWKDQDDLQRTRDIKDALK